MKWVPWSKTILCGTPWQCIRYFVSLQIVVFAKILHMRKVKHIKSILSSKNKMLPFPWWKWSSVINLPPSSWLIIPREWCLIRGLVLISIAGRLGTEHWLQKKSKLLSPCITSIPAKWLLYLWNHLAKTRMAGRRDWLVFTEHVNLST